MAVNPIMSTGVNAIHSGLKGLSKTAHEIAELNADVESTSEGDAAERQPRVKDLDETADAIIDLKLYQREVEAAARIVETADEVLGFLLEVSARK